MSFLRRTLRALYLCFGFMSHAAWAEMDLSRYDIVWETPSRHHIDSMAIGNGVVGANVWVNQAGKLCFYVARGDSFSADHILYKLGLIEISIEGRSRDELMKGFRQSTDLASGALKVQFGEAEQAIYLTLWFDAASEDLGHGMLNARSETPFAMRIDGIAWRERPETIPTIRRNPRPNSPANKAYHAAFGTEPIVFDADVVITDLDGAIGWYHWNPRSIFPKNIGMQGLDPWLEQSEDPLLHRGSGIILGGPNFEPVSETRLRSVAPQGSFDLHFFTATEIEPSEPAFVRHLNDGFAKARDASMAKRWEQHKAWWSDFWKRSWIELAPDSPKAIEAKGLAIQNADVPLRLGGNQEGKLVLKGDMARVRLYEQALPAELIAELAAHESRGVIPVAPPIIHFDFEHHADPGRHGRAGAMDRVGGLPLGSGGGVKVGNQPDGKTMVRFDGTGVMQASNVTNFGIERAVSLETWVRIEALGSGGAVLIHQAESQAGVFAGFSLSLDEEGHLQMATANGVLRAGRALESGPNWVHVVGTYDAKDGATCLYLNGELVGEVGGLGYGLADWQLEALERVKGEPLRSPEFRVTQAYLFQRAMNAYAGRGPFPIKFNGSIFTVPSPKEFAHGRNPDHRKWGGGYWFQNTRLTYWPMLATGDFDLMRSMLDCYAAMLPFYQYRTKEYYGIEGAQYLEMAYVWGGSPVAAYGANRGDLPRETILNKAHRYHFNAGLELSALLLDYFSFTEDEAYLEETVILVVDSVVAYFMRNYPRDENGLLLLEPSQSMESYHDTVNPLPDVAGLKWALERLLGIEGPAISAKDRERWTGWLRELPPIPTRELSGAPALSPAEVMRQAPHNFENPELYAVFPYRFFGVGKPDIEVALNAFKHRRVTGNHGWDQGAIQAAFLGLSDSAWGQVRRRSAMVHGESRWPAMWQAAFDHQPDQDHAGVFQTALQRMLIQSENDVIRLLPAWPLDKDVAFKLHAHDGTTVELDYRDGSIRELIVEPASRERSVILPEGLSRMKARNVGDDLFFHKVQLPEIRKRLREGRAAEFMDVLRTVSERFMKVETEPYDTDGPYIGRNLQAQVGSLALVGLIDQNRAAMDKAIEILVAATGQYDLDDYIKANGNLAVSDGAVALAIVFSWIGDQLSPEEQSIVLEDLSRMGDYLYRYTNGEHTSHGAPKPWGNHSVLGNNGLLFIAEILGNELWRDHAIEGIKGYLDTAIDANGAPFEGANYAEYGFQHSALAISLLEYKDGRDLLSEVDGVNRLQKFMLHYLFPWGGGVVPINQSDSAIAGSSSLYYASLSMDDAAGLHAWYSLLGDDGIPGMAREMHTSHYRMYPFFPLWTAKYPMLEPVSPLETDEPLSAEFERGMVSARTAWEDPNAGLFTFESAQQVFGSWDHPDENTFTFSAFGDYLLVDPGPNFLAPDSHGIILIDGLGYTKHGGPGHRTQGRVELFEDRGDSVYVVGDAADAYHLDAFERPLGRPVDRAERRILFVRATQPFLVVADSIQFEDGNDHTFTWQANYNYPKHMNQAEVEGNVATILGGRNQTKAEVRFLEPPNAIIEERAFKGRHGQISNMLTVEGESGSQTRFLAVITSAPKGGRLPDVSADGSLIALNFDDGGKWQVEVTDDNITCTSLPE